MSRDGVSVLQRLPPRDRGSGIATNVVQTVVLASAVLSVAGLERRSHCGTSLAVIRTPA